MGRLENRVNRNFSKRDRIRRAIQRYKNGVNQAQFLAG
jgi:hypothetical protein